MERLSGGQCYWRQWWDKACLDFCWVTRKETGQKETVILWQFIFTYDIGQQPEGCVLCGHFSNPVRGSNILVTPSDDILMQTLLVKAETISDAYIVASAVPVPNGKEICTLGKEVSTMSPDLPAKILTNEVYVIMSVLRVNINWNKTFKSVSASLVREVQEQHKM